MADENSIPLEMRIVLDKAKDDVKAAEALLDKFLEHFAKMNKDLKLGFDDAAIKKTVTTATQIYKKEQDSLNSWWKAEEKKKWDTAKQYSKLAADAERKVEKEAVAKIKKEQDSLNSWWKAEEKKKWDTAKQYSKIAYDAKIKLEKEAAAKIKKEQDSLNSWWKAEEKKKWDVSKQYSKLAAAKIESDQKKAAKQIEDDYKKSFMGAFHSGTTFGHKFATTLQYAVAGVGIYKVAEAFKGAIAESIRFDNALYNNMAVLNATRKEAEGLANASREIVKAYGGTIEETDKVILTLGRAGVASKDLADAVKVVSQLSTITGDTLSDTSKVVSTFRENFKDTGITVSELGQKIAYMANESKMSTEDLGTFSNYGLQTAKNLNLTVDAVGALATTMSNLGINASTIGTQMQKLEFVFNGTQASVSKFWDVLKKSNPELKNQNELLKDLKTGGAVGEKALLDFAKSVNEMDFDAFQLGTQGMEIRTKNLLLTFKNGFPVLDEHMKKIKLVGDLNAQSAIASLKASALWERGLATIATQLDGIVTSMLDFSFDRESLQADYEKLNQITNELVKLEENTDAYKEKAKELASIKEKLKKQTEEVNTSFEDFIITGEILTGIIVTLTVVTKTFGLELKKLPKLLLTISKNPAFIALSAAATLGVGLATLSKESMNRNKPKGKEKDLTDFYARKDAEASNPAFVVGGETEERKNYLKGVLEERKASLEYLKEANKTNPVFAQAIAATSSQIETYQKEYDALVKKYGHGSQKIIDFNDETAKQLKYELKIRQEILRAAGQEMTATENYKAQKVILDEMMESAIKKNTTIEREKSVQKVTLEYLKLEADYARDIIKENEQKHKDAIKANKEIADSLREQLKFRKMIAKLAGKEMSVTEEYEAQKVILDKMLDSATKMKEGKARDKLTAQLNFQYAKLEYETKNKLIKENEKKNKDTIKANKEVADKLKYELALRKEIAKAAGYEMSITEEYKAQKVILDTMMTNATKMQEGKAKENLIEKITLDYLRLETKYKKDIANENKKNEKSALKRNAYIEKYLADLEKVKSSMKPIQTEDDRLRILKANMDKEIAQINRNMKDNPRSVEIYKRQLTIVTEKYGLLSVKASDHYKLVNSASLELNNSLQDFFDINGEGWLDMEKLALNVLNNIMSEMIKMQVITPLVNGISSAASSFISPSITAPVTSGITLADSTLSMFAKGGVVDSPTLFPMKNGTGLMGEAGSEAIMPLTRINGDLGVKSAPPEVTINIENKSGIPLTSDMVTSDADENRKIINVVIEGVGRNTSGLRDMLKGMR